MSRKQVDAVVLDDEASPPKAKEQSERHRGDRRQAEHRKPDTEQVFRRLAHAMPAALWIGDIAANSVRFVNPAWEQVTGRRVVAGDRLERIYDAIHPDELADVLAGAAAGPNGIDLDCRLMRPDGIVRWAHLRTFPVDGPTASPPLIAGILDDITGRKEESQRADRLKDEFIATVSHELRTPLTSIAGALRLLTGGPAHGLPDSALRLLTIANSNGQRLIRLVNDILDIEKIASGKIVFVRRLVELRSLVTQAIEANRGFAEAYDVRVELNDAAVRGELHSDPDRLFQVLNNLLSNAIKFSPPGGTVELAIEQRGDNVRVCVRDHGPGIPDEFKPRIFERFAQADATDTRQKGGTGLGLNIVKQIVTRLGGQVGFADAPGGGTVFYADFPQLEPAITTASGTQAHGNE